MIANGAVVGVVATLVGAMIGFGLWFAYVPHLQAGAAHRIDASNLPWWTIGAAMAFAVVTAVAGRPAPGEGHDAEIPIVAALSGRPPKPKPAHRTAIPGAVLLAGGAYLLATAGGWGASGASATLHLLGGLVAERPRDDPSRPTLHRRPRHLGRRDVDRRCGSRSATWPGTEPAQARPVGDQLRSPHRRADQLACRRPLLRRRRLLRAEPGARMNSSSDTPTGAAAAGLTQNLCAPGERATPETRACCAPRRPAVHAMASTLKSTDVLPLETASGMLIQNSGRWHRRRPALRRHSTAARPLQDRPGRAGARRRAPHVTSRSLPGDSAASPLYLQLQQPLPSHQLHR